MARNRRCCRGSHHGTLLLVASPLAKALLAPHRLAQPAIRADRQRRPLNSNVRRMNPMSWQPLSEAKLWDLLNAAEQRMSPEIARFWEAIRVSPEKWKQEPWGREGGGFWVVAVLGNLVIWYNDIEDGFNYSKRHGFNEIEDYWCNQDDLEHTLHALLHLVQTGEQPYGRASPPVAGALPGASQAVEFPPHKCCIAGTRKLIR